MRKTTTVVIEDFAYELSQLGGEEGRILVIKFAQLLGRIIPLIASTKTLNADAAESIGSALAGLNPADLEPLWQAFSKSASVRGKDGKTRQNVAEVFDEHFAGEYYAMISFFVESARFNFGGFLAKAFAQASASQDTGGTPSASKSPKGSTGTSGA